MRVCVPGAAANVYWQMGAMDCLLETGLLDTVRAASAGAIAASLALCGVRSPRAIARAYEISDLYGVDLNPFGVVGTWGTMIRDWLNDVLPDDCASRCSDRLEVVLRSVATGETVYVTRFHSKPDLISALLATCHLPFVLDMMPVATFRGRWYVDGQLFIPVSWISGGCDLIVTYRKDPAYLAFALPLGRVAFRPRWAALCAAGFGYRWMTRRIATEKTVRPLRRPFSRPQDASSRRCPSGPKRYAAGGRTSQARWGSL